MKRTTIALLTAMTLGVAGFGAVTFLPAITAQAQGGTEATSTLSSQVFTIDNMTCAMCPVTVRTAMEGVSGVRSAQVDFDAKTATVIFDPSQTNVAAIAAASTNAGYPAHATRVRTR